MREILKKIETPYVDSQTLYALLSEYKQPRASIARMVQSGTLTRLKNGFFLINSRFDDKNFFPPYEQMANLLYGPSYVSLEWALSYYNIIPERVSVVTSVTTCRVREFKTPIGVFSYRHLSSARYAVGMDYKMVEGQLGGFLMATPEKALIDWIFFTCKGMNQTELRRDLIEGKRIEVEKLHMLDKDLVREIAQNYKSSVIRNFDALLRSGI